MRYAVIIEKGPESYGAYVPDLPGCAAAAETREQAVSLIQEAIELHIEALKEQGQPVPPPSSAVEFVDVAA
jgi:predicted RNase H-like HicB family nuclease